MHALKEGASRTVVERPINELTPNPRNARTHPKKQLRQLASSIERFGFINPVYINDDGVILVGHGRVEAARLLGLKQVPTLTLSHLSPAEQRAYMLADNKLALNAGWDPELLAQELQELIDIDFDVDLRVHPARKGLAEASVRPAEPVRLVGNHQSAPRIGLQFFLI